MYTYRTICFWIANVVLAVLLLPGSVLADEFLKFTDDSLGFTFEYPDSWEIRPPIFPNSRAVVGPKKWGGAECYVTVKLEPGTNGLSQVAIDEFVSQKPIAADFEEIFELQYNNVHVIAVGNSLLSHRPVQVVRVRYSAGTKVGEYFTYNIIFSTATPGKIWGIGCGGGGRSSKEAENNFKKWQMDINRLISTFQF